MASRLSARRSRPSTSFYAPAPTRWRSDPSSSTILRQLTSRVPEHAGDVGRFFNALARPAPANCSSGGDIYGLARAGGGLGGEHQSIHTARAAKGAPVLVAGNLRGAGRAVRLDVRPHGLWAARSAWRGVARASDGRRVRTRRIRRAADQSYLLRRTDLPERRTESCGFAPGADVQRRQRRV